ncbi:MAG: PqqD family protein [Lachnospiraceae bacterium]|jgi:hypothetical protein|nr:PqqD family protein [Lachnospiraceae bacterium]MCH4031828.1 PqqD family protein [Lachnospiraceae bacterium]MCH4070452.1 PqqD family protein [Lachnospiraceae bacterium]MCH4109119.1 PqqD family protein [Lachnospiraceae bacterium]MCI1302954.1 PqqD family protein [Lachnospiraceae bacterium]
MAINTDHPFQKTYQASEDYIQRNIAGSEVLISVGSNIADFNGYIELNSSAAILWKTLQSPCHLNDLIQVLENEYQVSHKQAVEDVSDFIQELINRKMVVVS